MARVDIFNEEPSGDFYKKYCNRVVNVALVGANQVRRHMGEDFKKKTWMQTLFEFVYFYIALTRDHGLAESDSTRRERVGDKLSTVHKSLNFLAYRAALFNSFPQHITGRNMKHIIRFYNYSRLGPFPGSRRSQKYKIKRI